MVKNALHFMLKALFDFEKFTFLSRLFDEVEKLLHEKARVNFKVYGVTEWRVYYYKHILSNISRSKGNQTMKFRQLIENNLRNLVEKLVTDFFIKKSELSMSLDQKFQM